jgi:hypothetical protein
MLTVTFICEMLLSFIAGCLFSMLLMWFILKLTAKYVLLNESLKEAAVLPPTPQGQNGTGQKPDVAPCTTSAIA